MDPRENVRNTRTRLTAILVVVERIAVSVGDPAGITCKGFGVFRKRGGVVWKYSDVVVIDARGTGIEAREATERWVPARELRGVDAGTLAAIATVVT